MHGLRLNPFLLTNSLLIKLLKTGEDGNVGDKRGSAFDNVVVATFLQEIAIVLEGCPGSHPFH